MTKLQSSRTASAVGKLWTGKPKNHGAEEIEKLRARLVEASQERWVGRDA